MTKGAREADLPKVTQSGGVGALPVDSKGASCCFQESHPFGVLPCYFRVLEVGRTGATAWAGPGLACLVTPIIAGRPVGLAFRAPRSTPASSSGPVLNRKLSLLKSQRWIFSCLFSWTPPRCSPSLPSGILWLQGGPHDRRVGGKRPCRVLQLPWVGLVQAGMANEFQELTGTWGSDACRAVLRF